MHEPSSPVEQSFQIAVEPSSPQTTDGAITDPPFSPWPLGLRIAFRFCFVYFGLFCLTTQIFTGMISTPWTDVPDLYTLLPLRQIIAWTASHVLHTHNALVFTGSGSGDKTTDWILVFLIAIVAVVTTAIWSALDRNRTQYSQLHAYFRLFIRFALASQLISYGLAKAFPMQMPYPGLTRLLEPFGNFSAMGVLWASIGASPAYERFAGLAELAAGVLLLMPRTTLLGALIAVLDMTQVFMLNMTYDVPVKILSFHLLLLAVFLAAPDLPRLFTLLFRNQAVAAPAASPIFQTRRAAQIALTIQLLYGAALLGLGIFDSYRNWGEYGANAPKPPLYGIWEADEYSIDGEIRQPVFTDKERWRRFVIDRSGLAGVQLMDDSLTYCTAKLDTARQTLTLIQRRGQQRLGEMSFEQPDARSLTLDGEWGSHAIRARLHLLDDTNKFPLRAAKFHWVNEYPVNR
jgi:uncharacterized membrane protein YphA (DoxX/SURF4 family)